jgi:hypothetical protein
MVVQSLGYPLCAKVDTSLIKSIPLPKLETEQLANGHFIDDLLFTIQANYNSSKNNMEFIDT